MLRCCLKTPTQGLTDDIITWEKESYTSLITEQIQIVSPPNETNFEVGKNIATVDPDILTIYTDNDILVKKITTVTKRYRLKKVVNGIEVVPTEYKNNGEVYSGESSSSWIMLKEDSYEISFTEQK